MVSIAMIAQSFAYSASSVSSAQSAPARLHSLDVFRGLTVAAMILVTDPGTYDFVYPPLRHALWNGATCTDMIFPAFQFMVGVAIPLALEGRLARGAATAPLIRRILFRSLLLILVGIFINAAPDFVWHTLRLPGILQRIGVCYACSSLLYLALRGRSDAGRRASLAVTLTGVAAALWIAYGLALRFIPVPGIGAGHLDPYGNLPAWIDRAVFGIPHLWAFGLAPGRGVTYDPEGLLSTIPAIGSTLIGVATGLVLRGPGSGTRKALTIAAAGMVSLVLSVLLSPLLPINKRIWTPTFALLSSGVCLCLFSCLYALIDLRLSGSSSRWTFPAVLFGTNALLAFILSSLLTTSLDHVHAGPDSLTLHTWGYHCFTPWLSPMHASLAYAVTIVLLNLALLYPFYRRRLFLRL